VRSVRAASRFAKLAPDGAAGDAGAVAAMVEEAGVRGLILEELTSRAGLTHDQVQAVATSLGDAVVRLGARLLSAPIAAQLEARVIETLAAHHAATPLSEGLPREELRERALPGVPHDIAAAILARLEHASRITGRERLAVAGHRLSLSADEARVSDVIQQEMLERGYQAPDAKELAEAAGAPIGIVDRVVSLLVRQKKIVRLDTLLYHPGTLEALKADVRTLESLDVAVFKTRYGITRKYAIPLLEYLDRERVTRRVGDKRVVNQ
ncbi:MAG: SelB C-terminal domain-containing protein, partial [Acidobacteriota bacterium]|nr:SelB C-terminal domain-containing protein [Acidobacteriota bacterium]